MCEPVEKTKLFEALEEVRSKARADERERIISILEKESDLSPGLFGKLIHHIRGIAYSVQEPKPPEPPRWSQGIQSEAAYDFLNTLVNAVNSLTKKYDDLIHVWKNR